MYTNVSNIIDTIIELLELNATNINSLIHVYKPNHNLSVFKGMRKTLPADAYPSLEIEPDNASNKWATTQSQRPTYNLNFTLTTNTDNEKLHVEYITTIATRIVEILTSPENLQLPVKNEVQWNYNGGLVCQWITDSLVEDITYTSTHEGAIRMAEWPWFALIHEPYPGSKFLQDGTDQPTVIRADV